MNKLKENIKSIVEKNISTISDEVKVNFKSYELEADILFKKWMALILISNEHFRIVIKFHFSENDILILSKKYTSLQNEKNKETILDFSKEITNQMGGVLKRVLEKNNITCGLSLPLVINSFDDIFSYKSPNSEYLIYKIWTDEMQCYLQFHLEFLSDNIRNTIELCDFSKANEEEEIEFL